MPLENGYKNNESLRPGRLFFGQRYFFLFVQNSTWHWRSTATSLTTSTSSGKSSKQTLSMPASRSRTTTTTRPAKSYSQKEETALSLQKATMRKLWAPSCSSLRTVLKRMRNLWLWLAMDSVRVFLKIDINIKIPTVMISKDEGNKIFEKLES